MNAISSANETEILAKIQDLAIVNAKERMQKKYSDFNETELKVVKISKECFENSLLRSSEAKSRYGAMAMVEGYSVTFQYKNDMFTLNTAKGALFRLQDEKYTPKAN